MAFDFHGSLLFIKMDGSLASCDPDAALRNSLVNPFCFRMNFQAGAGMNGKPCE